MTNYSALLNKAALVIASFVTAVAYVSSTAQIF